MTALEAYAFPPFAFLAGTIVHYTTAPLVKVIAVTKQSA